MTALHVESDCPLLTEAELDYVMPAEAPVERASLADVARQLYALAVAVRVVERPELAKRVDADLITDETMARLIAMLQDHSAIAPAVGALCLACALREDLEQVTLIEWLTAAPEAIRQSLPSLGELLTELSRPRPTNTTDKAVTARPAPFTRKFDNAAWLRDIERARSEHQQ